MQDRLTWIGGAFLVFVFIGVAAYVTARNAVHDVHEKSAAAAIALEPPPVGSPQPKAAVVDGLKFDFGYMQQGTFMEHDFFIKNEGEGPLKLEKGPTSCVCTMSELINNEVAPGAQAKIHLKWEPKGEFPSFRQTATIYTNDRDNSTVNLEVTGVVARMLSQSPTDLTLSKIPAGEARDGYFTIFSTATPKFEIEKIEFSDPSTADFYTIKTVVAGDKTLKDFSAKSGYEFTVTVKPGLPLGNFRQRLKIHHSIPNVDPIEMPVNGTIVGDVSIKGGGEVWNEDAGVLMLGRVQQRAGRKLNLKMFVKDAPADFNVKQVITNPADTIKVTCSEPKRTGSMSIVDVQVEIPAGSREQTHGGGVAEPLGEITIETNHPRTPQVKMLVKFDVVDA